MLDSFTTFWDASDRVHAPLVLPQDSPIIVVPGPDPDKVVLIGGGPAAGTGVSSHRQALTGALARQLVQHSRRGAVVEAIGRPDLRLEEIPQLLDGARIERFDAVVVTAGTIEALALRSKRSWTRALEAVLETAHRHRSRDGAVVVTGIPAPTSTGAVQGLLGRATDRHAIALNRTARSTVNRKYGHFATLTPAPHIDGQPTPAGYVSWASEICAVLEPLLSKTTERWKPARP